MTTASKSVLQRIVARERPQGRRLKRTTSVPITKSTLGEKMESRDADDGAGQRGELLSELEKAQGLTTELFNVVSHEFKTPLATIIGFAGLLARNDRLSQDQRENYLATIARQAERLNRLVDNILASGRRIEARGSLIARLDDAMEAVRAQLAGTYDDVSLDITVTPELQPRIETEALRLVLVNLVSNAVKHAAPDSTVEIVASREGQDVVISVTNEGEPVRLPPKRLFEPFVHDAGRGRSSEGVGLGLHIVDKVVAAYGGDVTVASTGSTVTFTVRIPEAGRSPKQTSSHGFMGVVRSSPVA
jgi:signal transduction histidine kinase